MAQGISQLENRDWNFKGVIKQNGTTIAENGVIKANIQDTLATGSIYIGDNTSTTSEIDIKTSGQILVGTGTTAASVAVSGDITLIANGTTALVAADLETATLTNIADTEILIGTGAGTANYAVLSGDVTLANTGAATVAALDLETATVTNIADTEIMIGTGAGTANFAALTGPIGLTNAGVTSIAGGSITTLELEGLASAQFFIGVDGTSPNNSKVVMSGDATMSNTGVVSVNQVQTEATCLRVADDAAGANFNIQQDSASPAKNDTVGTLAFVGRDDGAGKTTYAGIRGIIDDATAGAEFGVVQVRVQNGTGSMADVAAFTHDGAIGQINTGRVRATAYSGAVGTNVTAAEYGDGYNHTTVLTLTNVDLGAIGGAGALALGALIYTFPAGAHLHSVTSASIAIQGDAPVQADTPELAIGSLIASGAVATIGAVDPTAEDYTAPLASITDCNGSVNEIAMQGAVAGLHTGISFNATGDTKAVNLNVADTWSGASTTLLATGTVTLQWVFHG